MLFSPIVTLNIYEINNITNLTINTVFQNNGGSGLEIGDEISLEFPNPYFDSDRVFKAGRTNFPFYSGFP